MTPAFQDVFFQVIIAGGTGSGLFVYSPGAGANTLVASIVATAGTDPYGNTVLAGDATYNLGSPWSATVTDGQGLTYYVNTASGESGSWTQSGQVHFRTASSPQVILPSGFTGVIPATLSDSTTFTATQTTVRQLSNAYSLPANDAAANTIYRLTVWGNGTQGGTARNASWSVTIGASGNGVSTVSVIALGVAGSAWAAGVSANFRAVIELQCTAAGASGNFNADGEFLLTNSSTAVAIYAAALVDNTNTVDTTLAHFIQFNWQWSGGTGSTVSSYGSILERFSG
jgi:hypothetical protein